jgi:uncharacterized membrane protein YeiB
VIRLITLLVVDSKIITSLIIIFVFICYCYCLAREFTQSMASLISKVGRSGLSCYLNLQLLVASDCATTFICHYIHDVLMTCNAFYGALFGIVVYYMWM